MFIVDYYEIIEANLAMPKMVLIWYQRFSPYSYAYAAAASSIHMFNRKYNSDKISNVWADFVKKSSGEQRMWSQPSAGKFQRGDYLSVDLVRI